MKNFEISWTDLTVNIKTKKNRLLGTSKTEKTILHNATGRVASGSFVAIMGPSGAGKTTLLATLGGKVKDFVGSISINGQQLSSSDIKKLSGFMDQFFITTESLTVQEHLMFMIALKARVQRKYREEVFQRLLLETGLEKCKNTEICNLSGGEKKKLALATEIVSNPLILYCDEPTTGLDSSSAMAVMESLKTLTTAGKIVIFVIHQPSSQLYNYFDDLILLASGKVIFQGKRNVMQNFFNSINLICPKSYNPADFYLNYLVLSDNACLEKLKKQAALFTTNDDNNVMLNGTSEEWLTPVLKSKNKINILEEIMWLIWRSYINTKRNKKKSVIQCCIFMVSAITINLLFSESELNSLNIQNFNGLLYLTASEIIYESMFPLMYVFPESSKVFYAEEGIYSPFSYFISKILEVIPRCVGFSVLFLAIVYMRVYLPGGLNQFLIMLVITCIGSFSSAIFGLCVSANFQTLDSITFVAVPWTIITSLTSGIYVKLSSLSTYIQWIKYLSPFYYIFQSLAIIQWMQVSKLVCSEDKHLPCYQNGTDVLESLGFAASYSQVVENIVYILIITMIWSIIGLFGLSRKRNI